METTVERARRLVHGNLLGSQITVAHPQPDDKVFQSPWKELQAQLVNKTVKHTDRRGKYLIVLLDSGTLILHFGMTGSIQIQGIPVMKYKDFKTSDQEWPPRFMKLELEFSNGQKLAFTDSRRFGKVWYIPEKEDPYQVLPLSKLGPDAFNDLPRLSEFQDLVRKKRVPIKSLLLDQSFLAGIGNWIADEVLFQSHIHPGSSTLMLDDNELKKLHDSIQMVLSVAIDANSDSDLFPKSWIFHSRWDKKTAKNKDSTVLEDGRKVHFVQVGGRTSAIVSSIQRLKKGPSSDWRLQEEGGHSKKE